MMLFPDENLWVICFSILDRYKWLVELGDIILKFSLTQIMLLSPVTTPDNGSQVTT